MATAKHPLTESEVPFVIEALRKLAMQYDTKRKYAIADGDEDATEAFSEDITFVRTTLTKLGDARPLRLKSERVVKAVAKAKPKAKARPKAQPKADLTAIADAIIAKA